MLLLKLLLLNLQLKHSQMDASLNGLIQTYLEVVRDALVQSHLVLNALKELRLNVQQNLTWQTHKKMIQLHVGARNPLVISMPVTEDQATLPARLSDEKLSDFKLEIKSIIKIMTICLL